MILDDLAAERTAEEERDGEQRQVVPQKEFSPVDVQRDRRQDGSLARGAWPHEYRLGSGRGSQDFQ